MININFYNDGMSHSKYLQYYQFLIEHIQIFIEQFLIIFIINIFDSF